jgi:hypothetical protein
MLLAHVMVDAIDAALKNREESFDGIRVHISADVFVGRMVYCPVAGEPFADLPVDAALIGAEV